MTDELEKFDLSAWEAPEPPANLADAVLARMASADSAAEVPAQAPTRRRRVWLIAAIAAACLALLFGGYALIRGGTRHTGPSSGNVIAYQAQTLTLGDGVRAELDAGAQVTWRRQGGVMHVDQRVGAAAWRVSDDEKVVIDAGATVASVEATGASLRVEVKMNQADARLIGATALTAMAVSVVTVVVYQGHVKVSGSQGQPTVIVQPGSTYTVTPPPPADQLAVGASQARSFDPSVPTLADLRLPGGESATIHTAHPPVVVELAMDPDCNALIQGDQLDGTTASLELGMHTYSVRCKGARFEGTLEVIKDDASRPILTSDPPVNPIAPDGRTYRISFAYKIPSIKVSGTGRLHLVRDATERTYDGDLIPGTDLQQGQYSFWRAGSDKLTTLIIEHDQTSPMLELRSVTWNPNAKIDGKTYPDSTIAVRDIRAPVATDGRFSIVSDDTDVVAIQVAHPARGVHYFVVRAPSSATVAVGPNSKLDRATIMKVMKGAGTRVAACASKAKGPGTGKIIVKTTIAPDGSVSAATATSTFDADISDCIVAVVRTLQFPKSQSGINFSFPFQITGDPACDARKYAERGRENIDVGQHAAALAQFEAALKCTPNDAMLLELAFVSACNSRNEAKARRYFAQLPRATATRLEQVCIRNSVNVGRVKPACDADAAKDAGMNAINMGEHALALKKFEESLKCKQDPYVLQLAFMEACASQNSQKAQEYYPRMTPGQQSKFAQICKRQSPPVQYQPAPRTVHMPGPDDGFLQVISKPTGGKILIDGKDTGLTTPISGKELPLSPGKHKVTFVIGDDRFTYPVLIKTGETQTMSKDLE